MKRLPLLQSLCAVPITAVLLLGAGCGPSDEANNRNAPDEGVPSSGTAPAAEAARGPEMTVTGCLTANPDGRGFALTPSDTANTPAERAMQMPGRETVTYELVGNSAELTPHANSVVTVRGREDASARREADVERSDEAEQQPAPGAKDTPTVETTEEVDVNVRRLHASNVVPTGNACPSIGRMGGKATEPSSRP